MGNAGFRAWGAELKESMQAYGIYLRPTGFFANYFGGKYALYSCMDSLVNFVKYSESRVRIFRY